MENKFLNCFCLTLTIIGAVNWGLIGFFNFNLVALIFGSMSWISRIIYALVGLSGLYPVSYTHLHGAWNEEDPLYMDVQARRKCHLQVPAPQFYLHT